MSDKLNSISNELLNKNLKACSNEECYEVIKEYVARLEALREREDKYLQSKLGKKLYYISAEFLIGKLMSNNLINLGVYDEVRAELEAAGKELAQIEEIESEASLGNGGLGRLAACFLDSIANLGLNGDGVGLNYHLGLFRQVFENGRQKEVPDYWIGKDSWLIPTDVSYKIDFADFSVTSRMYDINVYGEKTTNKLHLFDIATVNEAIVNKSGIDFDKDDIKENLTLFLYPDDSDEKGRMLRIYQQYFMVSNGARLILDECRAKCEQLNAALTDGERKSYRNLPELAVIQINDTHPTLAIPELMRILLDEEGLSWETAWRITQNTISYTNHTILAEALEKWPIDMFKGLLPRIYMIIEEINRRYCEELWNKYLGQWDKISRMSIIGDGYVRMANLAIVGSHSVNGVAKLHTEILKKREMSDFYYLYPSKFNNKTNGITHRRWLIRSNPKLTNLLIDTIGDSFIKHPTDLENFKNHLDDSGVLQKLAQIKKDNKERLAKEIYKTNGIIIDTNSIFDVQIKRIHAYKRQTLNCLRIMDLYNKLIENPNLDILPRTFIFAGKAAPGYYLAKNIIELICRVAETVNNDPRVNDKIKVVMLENYQVSLAEKIIPAADLSEQISTTTKEASGTSNMKFMMNGAITIATLDGANIEIKDEVGEDNIIIFGLNAEEVLSYHKHGGYSAWEVCNNDPKKSN